MTPTDPHLWVVILAGGVGSRFWPASTGARPKQLLPLASDRPLVVDTVDRALGLVPPERIRIVASRALEEALGPVLPGLPPSSFLWEPRGRGTAPALAWAAREIARSDPGGVMVSLHSDHVIEPVEGFYDTVLLCVEAAREHDVLVTIGVRPARPDTGYGYIQPGPELEGGSGRKVLRFHEKPAAATAEGYVAQGFLWNSGIFVWSTERFAAELEAHAPDVAEAAGRLDGGDVDGYFGAVAAASVDESVLERSMRVAVVEAGFRWDDVGSWEALARTRETGEDGTVSVGPYLGVDSEDNIVYTEDGPVTLFGVEGLVVVRTRGMTLVTTRERSRDLKQLFERLPVEWRSPES